MVEKLRTQQRADIEKVAQTTVELGVALAERLVNAEIACDCQRLDRIVRDALERMQPGRAIVVRGHADDLALLQGQLAEHGEIGGALTFRAEKACERGQVKIEADEWFIEFDTQRSLTELRDRLLGRNLRKRVSPWINSDFSAELRSRWKASISAYDPIRVGGRIVSSRGLMLTCKLAGRGFNDSCEILTGTRQQLPPAASSVSPTISPIFLLYENDDRIRPNMPVVNRGHGVQDSVRSRFGQPRDRRYCPAHWTMQGPLTAAAGSARANWSAPSLLYARASVKSSRPTCAPSTAYSPVAAVNASASSPAAASARALCSVKSPRAPTRRSTSSP